VGDPADGDEPLVVVDRVDDAVVADPDAIVVAARTPNRTVRARFKRERVDHCGDPLPDRVVEAAERMRGRRVKADLVGPRRGYSRTSDQGTAKSRSSRARSAARLSSR
jgi:hypothetical protein